MPDFSPMTDISPIKVILNFARDINVDPFASWRSRGPTTIHCLNPESLCYIAYGFVRLLQVLAHAHCGKYAFLQLSICISMLRRPLIIQRCAVIAPIW
jgi:hypothetical protein